MTHEQQIDTELAALYGTLLEKNQRIAMREHTIRCHAGAKWYYRGKQRVTDMTVAEAEEIVSADLMGDDYFAPHARGTTLAQVRDNAAELESLRCERAAIITEMQEKEKAYTGWSRFFLVVSSPGHIHSSMHCSTCRFTTTYGWLPELSGLDEADAVAAHGPALCTVCFPSAPVEWTTEKLTKAQAEKAAA